MKTTLIWTVGLALALALQITANARTRTSFNDDWLFAKGDPSDAETAGFDDSEWRAVRLPHDWAIEGPFDIKYNARCGGLPYHGVGWYRKRFTLPEEDRGKVVTVEFDGAMNNAAVWINGHYLGKRPFGYIGFHYNLTPHLNFGEENVIAVKLSPVDFSSRWYPGAGIYRNTWLETVDPVHVDHWGHYITTESAGDGPAVVTVRTTLKNAGSNSQRVTLETTIYDDAKTTVATASTPVTPASGATEDTTQTLVVKSPKRWDLDAPHLYTAVTRVLRDDVELDLYETRFGIRDIAFSREKGFTLNGKPVRFNGVCMHHDLGPLGAAVNRRAIERQLQIMKAMGVNAIRTSHNPPSPEVLEFCDAMGLLVQVEAFDCWAMAKKGAEQAYNLHFEEWHERDLRDMIRRDRNHPSVVMWSIGNEIMEQSNKQTGAKWARTLTAICHDEDSTRPVTAGFNNYPGCIKNGLAAELDLVGLNYKPAKYAEALEQNPDMILYGSETSSCTSSRGVYHFPLEKYDTHESLQVTSYDFIAPNWAVPPDYEFAHQEQHPEILGEFIWTGFDYLGEPTPYGGRDHSTNGYWNGSWPSRSSYFGAVDLCGFPKDRYYLYQSQWTDEPMVHLLPHWNWQGREGEEIPVYCYTNCDEAELFVNGKSAGRKKRGAETTPVPMGYRFLDADSWESKYRMRWDIPYAPGTIKVVGYKDGEAVSEKTIRTAGKPARVKLIPDRETIGADGDDLSFITVRVEDSDGNLCPLADNLVRFKVKGPATIAAVGNGNSATVEPFQADYRKAFNGQCLLIVRGAPGAPGSVSVQANSDGLYGGKCAIQTVVP